MPVCLLFMQYKNRPFVDFLINRAVILFLAVLVLFLFSGCTKLPLNKGPTQIENVPAFQKGYGGLTLKFLQNAPPDEVFEKSSFKVGVEYYNDGAYDINEGIIKVMAFAPFSISGESTREIMLKAKSLNNPLGSRSNFIVDVNSDNFPASSFNQVDGTIQILACYRYETEALEPVCIDTDPFNQKQSKKPCRVSDITLSGGQGAPISIDKIEVSMMPHSDQTRVKPTFRIYISNNGNGIPVRASDYATLCQTGTAADQQDTINTIEYTVKLGGSYLECSPDEIHLKDNEENYITCWLSSGIPLTQPTYLEPLEIKLSYGYTVSLKKEVRMVKTK